MIPLRDSAEGPENAEPVTGDAGETLRVEEEQLAPAEWQRLKRLPEDGNVLAVRASSYMSEEHPILRLREHRQGGGCYNRLGGGFT